VVHTDCTWNNPFGTSYTVTWNTSGIANGPYSGSFTEAGSATNPPTGEVFTSLPSIRSRAPHRSPRGNSPGLQGAKLAPQVFGQGVIQCLGCGAMIDSNSRVGQET
jgi:hypothetical protein